MVLPKSICRAVASGSASPSHRIPSWQSRDASKTASSPVKNNADERDARGFDLTSISAIVGTRKQAKKKRTNGGRATTARRFAAAHCARRSEISSGPELRPRRHAPRPPRQAIEELLSGEVVRTPLGGHFETERVWERHRRHGSVGIADLNRSAARFAGFAFGGRHSPRASSKVGLPRYGNHGLGAGACAFLVGVGSIDASGFRLRQFFLRDYGEEPSLLWRLAEYLAQFDALITYNGRTFDQPLLEGAISASRACRTPSTRLPHLDMLFGARRLWKLRLDSLPPDGSGKRILGVERQGDLPGDLIPYYYFEFQRTHQAFRLVPIFHHNALDILSLACLTAIVPVAFRSPHDAGFQHGADLIGLARWLRDAGRDAEALGLLRRAVEMGLPDPLLFRTLWDIAAEERRRGAVGSLAALERSRGGRNPYQAGRWWSRPSIMSAAKRTTRRRLISR